jgi:hypothetical protein
MVGFGISGVEPSGSATTVLVKVSCVDVVTVFYQFKRYLADSSIYTGVHYDIVHSSHHMLYHVPVTKQKPHSSLRLIHVLLYQIMHYI